jgi:3-hydroxyisobutyrate dehydrogenase-like beta-hydroxyacid dehydrogenase
MTIAFIGFGRMGAAMAPRLAQGGHDVIAWNRTAERIPRDLRRTDSLADAVTCAETVILMTDETGSEAVVGALTVPLEGRVVALMGTHAPPVLDRLAGRIAALGGRPVEAPVLGTTGPAVAGTLVVLAGGDGRDIDALRPVFTVLARKVVHTGAIGTATAMKFAHNLMLSDYFLILGEAMALAETAGIDRAALLDVLIDSPAANGLLALKRPLLLGEGAAAAFNLRGMAKEMAVIREFALAHGLTLPVVDAVARRAAEAVAQGEGDADVSALALSVLGNFTN